MMVSFIVGILKQSRRAETAVILVAVSCIITIICINIYLKYYAVFFIMTDVIQKKEKLVRMMVNVKLRVNTSVRMPSS